MTEHKTRQRREGTNGTVSDAPSTEFVQGFHDRHGKPRWYFRRPGFKQVPLPGLRWSGEFNNTDRLGGTP